MKRPILNSPQFARRLRKLLKREPQQRTAIVAVLKQLAEDAFAPSLHTHKLHGNLANLWSCSVAYDLRIVFELIVDEKQETILLITIGKHDEVY